MQRIAATLGLDPLEVIRRNLVQTFPHRGIGAIGRAVRAGSTASAL
jgi:CO/xanthine dehydrogenase Mo-binding subunit